MNKLIIILFFFIVTIISSCDNSNYKKNFVSGDNVDSLLILSELLAHDSLNPKLLANRAEIYLQKGKIDPALRDLHSALELAPDDPQLFILLSNIYFALGQTENCIASLKKAIRLNPKDEEPYLKLSETYLLINKPKAAIQYADEAIRINRKNAESYYVKGLALLENRDTSSAILNFGISTNIDSNNYMAFMQLGAIYTKQNDPISATYFKKALVTKPNDERALYFLGMFYQEDYKFTKAIEMFTTVTDLYPENKRAYYNMGYIYLVELEDFENAKIMFQKAILINPRYVEAVYNLGRTYEVMGDFESARKQYKTALELLPNYPLAVQGMNRIDDILFRKR